MMMMMMMMMMSNRKNSSIWGGGRGSRIFWSVKRLVNGPDNQGIVVQFPVVRRSLPILHGVQAGSASQTAFSSVGARGSCPEGEVTMA